VQDVPRAYLRAARRCHASLLEGSGSVASRRSAAGRGGRVRGLEREPSYQESRGDAKASKCPQHRPSITPFVQRPLTPAADRDRWRVHDASRPQRISGSSRFVTSSPSSSVAQ
jgi:hypothetical protein